MNAPVQFKKNNNTFWLHADKTMFWEEKETLVISDIHLGKTGHFRKNGIAIPTGVYVEDLQRLVHNITYYKAKKIIVVGDMFHSAANRELEFFSRWRRDINSAEFVLVKGNHDILKQHWYIENNITVFEGELTIDNFCFVHEAPLELKEDVYYISGHIHPGISIKGISRQRLSFPCFYFGKQQAILPAFSKFTGIHIIKPQKTDHVFGIINDSLIKV